VANSTLIAMVNMYH